MSWTRIILLLCLSVQTLFNFGFAQNHNTDTIKPNFWRDTIEVSTCLCPSGKLPTARPGKPETDGYHGYPNTDNYDGFWCGRKFWFGHEQITDHDDIPVRINSYLNGKIIDSTLAPIFKYTCTSFNFYIKTFYNKQNGKFNIKATWTGGNGDTLEFRFVQKGYLVSYWTASDLNEKAESKEMELETGMYHLKVIKKDSVIYENDVLINPNHY